MADAKSMLESIARSFGYIYGREKHVRINTISQSPTATTAGKGIKDIENMMDFADKMSPLGNAVAEDCANYCVMMFSDFTRKVTMQNLFHDGGFSSMGMSLRAMNQYAKDMTSYEDENGNVIVRIIRQKRKNLTKYTDIFSKNLSIPVFLFISTLYLKLGNKRKMIAVSTQISWTEIGAERFLPAIFLISSKRNGKSPI